MDWLLVSQDDLTAQRTNEQKVRFMMILLGSNSEAMSQSVLGKLAEGVPHLSVLIMSVGYETSRGTESSVLAQNQTLIK